VQLTIRLVLVSYNIRFERYFAKCQIPDLLETKFNIDRTRMQAGLRSSGT